MWLSMNIFGINIPFWISIVALIIGVVIVWKIIKFAIKILLVIIAILLGLYFLYIVGFFSIIRSLLSYFL